MTTRRELLILIVLAIAVRSASMFALYRGLNDDVDLYRLIAETLRATGEYALPIGSREEVHHGALRGDVAPTAFRPPLYPIVLSALVWQGDLHPIAVAKLHVLLGAATVAGTFLLARRLGQTWSAWAAAMFVLFDPILVNQASLVMTETLAAFMTVCAMGTLVAYSGQPTWQRAMLAGATIGLCVLCRPTYLIWLPLVLGEVVLKATFFHRRGIRVREFAALACGAILVLAPWTVRNAIVFGKPIVATTHGGYTLYLGNNEEFYGFVMSGKWFEEWQPFLFHIGHIRKIQPNGRDETIRYELLYDEREQNYAIDSIQLNPGEFMIACAYRVFQFWNPLPNDTNPPNTWRNMKSIPEPTSKRLARYTVCLWYIAIYILAIAGLSWWRTGKARDGAIWAITLVAAFMLIHTFYWTNLRMRAPIMPLVALTAAAGLQRLTRHNKVPNDCADTPRELVA